MVTTTNQKGESITFFKHSIIRIKTIGSETTVYFIDGSFEVFNFDATKLSLDILPMLK